MHGSLAQALGGGGKAARRCGRVARHAAPAWRVAALAMLLTACGGGGGGADVIEPFDSAGDVAVVDLDGDGRLDVVATVSHVDGPPPHAGSVKVWLQRADLTGAFTQAVGYAVGPDPWELRVADVDGDAVPDLVVMSSHASAVDGSPLVDVVTVLRGDPARRGHFLPGATLHAGLPLTDIAVADLDGDGLPDIAFTGHDLTAASLGVWWSRAAEPESYEAPVRLAMVGAGALVAADLDADGRRDLAYVGGADGDEAWMLARDPASPRGFRPAVRVGGGTRLSDLLAADLDRDGLTDLVLGSRASALFGTAGELISLRNDPSQPGRFLPLQRLPLARHTWECVSVDMDADGMPDLVASGSGWDNQLFDDIVEVFLGVPGAPGLFGPAVQTVTRDTGSGWHLAAGDLDGDGVPELVMPFEGGVLLLRQDPARPGALLRGPALP